MATNTYVALATQTLATAASSVTFSSIPSGYTDLVLVYSAKVSTAADLALSFNGVTGTSYSTTYLSGTGSSAVSSRSSNAGGIFLDYYGYPDATNFNVAVYNIMNYSNTTTYKTVLGRSGNAATGTDAIVGTYRDTAAITSLTIDPVGAPTLSTGSTFNLYGVAAASVGAKATGGTIYQDSSYFYHVFSGNGTFTPSQSISADVLVVAGGGGGGGGGSTWANGGGGGAGGIAYYSSQSLTATGYTCTVGGPGAGGVAYTKGASGTNSSFTGLTAAVGGGAGGGYSDGTGSTGGSGGGGGGLANVGNSGGSATSGQGYAGGNGFNNASSDGNGGGGGGAGGAGENANVDGATFGGDGGLGVATYNTWSLTTGIGQDVSGTYYLAGGGGGGAGTVGNFGSGGLGGGGNGGNGNANGANGLIYSGSGGGGCGAAASGGGTIGGNGGSGVVIVRYAK